MNIIIFSHDLPYPANHGGRIDMYNRLRAFKELNHNVFLICWALHEDNKREDSKIQMEKIVTDLVVFKRNGDVVSRIFDVSKKALKLAIQPNLVTQCTLGANAFLTLKNRITAFKPEAIFVDNIYASKLAYKYASAFNLPVFIRTHNIEHIYIRKMAKLAKSFKTKLKFLAMAANLKKFEISALSKADAFFEISLSDLAFWKSMDLNHGYWMPPVYYRSYSAVDIDRNSPVLYDISYVGNLNSPNNVDSILWFLNKILPNVKNVYPDVRILIAGSKPIPGLVDICQLSKNVLLITDPADVSGLYAQSRILINPIRFGSGVNVKTVEILHMGKPVVCTSKAIEGFPAEMKSLFDVSDDAETFASNILKYLRDPDMQQSPREEMIAFFEPSYLKSNINVMQKIVNAKRKTNLIQ